MREQVDAGILGAVPNVVNAETRRKLLPKNRTIQNDVRASLAADNGALEIGRPAGIGPGARQEQIENRTPLKRSSDLGAGPQRQPRVGSLFLSESRDLTIGLKQAK